MNHKAVHRSAYLAWRALTGRGTEMFAPHGVPVRVPREADLALRYLLARGRAYEAEEAGMVRDLLPPGCNVIELGGCMGILSALIRATIGPEARHLVVEANPDLQAICAENAARGAAPGRTETLFAAVDHSGAATVRFGVPDTVHDGRVGAGGARGTEVPAVTLEALVARMPAAAPLALVCDIEGAEVGLVEAGAHLLPRFALIVMETHPRIYARGTAERDALVARIEAAGFNVARRAQDVLAFVPTAARADG